VLVLCQLAFCAIMSEVAPPTEHPCAHMLFSKGSVEHSHEHQVQCTSPKWLSYNLVHVSDSAFMLCGKGCISFILRCISCIEMLWRVHAFIQACMHLAGGVLPQLFAQPAGQVLQAYMSDARCCPTSMSQPLNRHTMFW